MTAGNLTVLPWGRKGGDEEALKDVLARVNLERGHFRDITEASLQEEIAADGALELSSSDEEDEEDDEDKQAETAIGHPTTREELFKAKWEMLGNINAAQQEILISLDFVSLLLSKDAAKQAATTVSPSLKEAVPLGSLGMDMWERMPEDKARSAQDELLATNVKMQSLRQSADTLLSAATRLQNTVRRETAYWDQVLSVSAQGWHVSRIPGQQHRLAVRFGFSESSPEFARRGLAPLVASGDGGITLERGVGRRPRALRVTLRRGDRIVGTSRLPDIADTDDVTLETRIRYARDSLYDEELYHEVIRESRTLASLGVNMEDSEICFEAPGADEGVTVALDLVSLDDTQNVRFDIRNAEDRLAEATVLAARLLLGAAHRDRLKKRSAVPPPLSDNRENDQPALPILRPMLSLVMHQTAVRQLNGYIKDVTETLQAARLVVQDSTEARFHVLEQVQTSNAEALALTLLQPWRSKARLTVAHITNQEIKVIFSVHTDLSNPNNFASSITVEVSTSEARYHFDSMSEAILATDVKLAAALAQSIPAVIGDDELACDASETSLVKDNGLDEQDDDLRVMLNSASRTISIRSSADEIIWAVNGESSSKGFWEAAADLVRSRPADDGAEA